MPQMIDDDLPERTPPPKPKPAPAGAPKESRNPLIPRMKLTDYRPDQQTIDAVFAQDVKTLRNTFGS